MTLVLTVSLWATYTFRQVQGERQLELVSGKGHRYTLLWARYASDVRGWLIYESCDEGHRHYIGEVKTRRSVVNHQFFPTANLAAHACKDFMDFEGLPVLECELAAEELALLCRAVEAWTALEGLEGRYPGHDLLLAYFRPAEELISPT